jgi:hypothetical protein
VLSQAEALAKAEALAIMVISGPAPKRRGDIALLQPMLHAMLHAMPEKYKFLPPRTMPTCASLGTAVAPAKGRRRGSEIEARFSKSADYEFHEKQCNTLSDFRPWVSSVLTHSQGTASFS